MQLLRPENKDFGTKWYLYDMGLSLAGKGLLTTIMMLPKKICLTDSMFYRVCGDTKEVVDTHLNTNHVHNHFVVNSVSMKDGHKYIYSNHEMARLRQTNDFICKEYGLSSLEEKVTRKNFDFSKYMNHDNYSVRTQRDIDIAIKNSFNYQDFINTMKKMNYEVIERYGKLSVRYINMRRNIRIERQFGEDYTIDNIYRRITEEVPDKLTTEELTTYNYHKNKYYKNKHSLGAMFLYFIFRIKTYEKSPRNYPISEEMKKRNK